MTAYEFVAKVFVLVSCLDPRLSLPEISSFQGNSKFFFLNIPIYYARARRTLGSLARASSQSTYRKLARHVRCPLHSRHFFSFLFLLFTIAPHAFMGGGEKNVGRVDDWSRSQYFSVSCTRRNLYRSLNEIFFATRSLESV